jgi:hypothetical protein
MLLFLNIAVSKCCFTFSLLPLSLFHSMRTLSIIGSIFALGLTIIPGYYHGQKNFRWGTDPQLVTWGERLADLPTRIGAWQMTGKEKQLQQVELDQLEPIGYVARSYTNGPYTANLFVLLGPTGPTAAHTPDICFNASQYRTLGERRRARISDSPTDKSEAWVSRFESRGVDKHMLKSWYAWTVDGEWHAADNPRFDFAESRFLFKIQIAMIYSDRDSMELDEVGDKFVNEVRDYLKETLFQ